MSTPNVDKVKDLLLTGYPPRVIQSMTGIDSVRIAGIAHKMRQAGIRVKMHKRGAPKRLEEDLKSVLGAVAHAKANPNDSEYRIAEVFELPPYKVQHILETAKEVGLL